RNFSFFTCQCSVESLASSLRIMEYGNHKTDDQVAAGRGAGSVAFGPGGDAGVLVEVLPQGLHPAPAVRRAGAQDVPQGRLPRRRRAPGRLLRASLRFGPVQAARPLHALLRRQKAAKKGDFVVLLFAATARAEEAGLIGEKPTAAVDATGMER